MRTLRHTKQLVELLSGKKPPMLGAEIGVWDGRNSKVLLDVFDSLSLYLIDNYGEMEETSWNNYQSSEVARAMKQEMLQRFEEYDSRAVWLLERSESAANKIEDDSLDFVFIDGDHHYETTKQDILLYSPKVKKGGLISGHDYARLLCPGVVKAVNEVFGKKVSISDTGSRVWWVWK